MIQTLNGAVSLPAHWRGGIAALGNFDGVHPGHRAVIQRAIQRAKHCGRPALVITFEPHPVSWFRPDTAPFRLTTVEQRARVLGSVGVDGMVVLPFDQSIATLDPRSFFHRVLIERLGLAGVSTGENFRFGRDRSGDVELLRVLGQDAGIPIDAEGPVLREGLPVSSTRVRIAIRAGDVVEAARLLGRPFAIAGDAIQDDDGGAIKLRDYVRPRPGPYRLRIRDRGRTWLDRGRLIQSSRADGDDRLRFRGIPVCGSVEVELLSAFDDGHANHRYIE